MLRPERMTATRRLGVMQTLMIQALLAVVILVAAWFSRDRPVTFWLTLSLLAVPIAVGATYLSALVRASGQKKGR